MEVLRARDISVGGVGVSVAHGFSRRALQEEVRIVLVLPKSKPISATGVIRHLRGQADGGSFGVEFVGLSNAARAQIQKLVDELLARGRRA